MIIKVKSRTTVPLYKLVQLAIEYAYERKKMRADKVAMLQDGIIAWSKKLDYEPGEQEVVERIGWFLKKAESPKFQERVEMFKAKGVDWRKFHKVPYDRSN